jgi:hypothetical protein
MLKFIEEKWLCKFDPWQSHKLAPWVRRAHRKHIAIAIIIGLIFSAMIVAIMLYQNRNWF